jgi:hypothetical protein
MNGVSSSSFTAAYHTILSTDGGERIFREFGLDVGKRYVSPFRPDATRKNFSVFRSPNGHVGFKDFASGDGGLFTALLYGFGYTTFEAQIRFAASVYGIEVKEQGTTSKKQATPRTTDENVPQTRPTAAFLHSSAAGRDTRHQATNDQVTKKTKNQKLPTKNQKTYRVTALELDDFTPVELQTLARVSSGLITPELLASYGIRALRSYTDEGVSDKGFAYGGKHEARFTLVVPSANGNYYAYCYFGAEKHSPFPSQSKNFHLKLGEYTAEVKFALGLAELRPNEPAYLVEGIKDCLILLAKGYNAFTLGGVQHRLHPSVVKRLQENGNSLNIVFDTDFAGISAAQKLSSTLKTQHSTLNTQHFILPRLERQETKEATKPAKNDLADYVCQYGFDDELTHLLLRPQLAQNATIIRTKVTTSALSLHITRTLSETTGHIAFLQGALAKHPRLALYAPTGCGKTYTLLRFIAPHRVGRTIFTVPTVALAEQIDREYGHPTSSACKLVCITGKDDATTLLEARTSAKIIVCTYNSLHKVLYGMDKKQSEAVSLLDDDTILVVDEAHKLHEEYHFRKGAILSVLNALRQAKYSLLMSATPSLLWQYDRSMPYTQLVVHSQERTPVHCTPIYYNSSAIHATITLILHERAKAEQSGNNRGVIAVRFNNANSLRAIQDALAKLGIAAENIDRITAKSRDTSDTYKSIMEHGHINTPIILTTSALDCGVNIYNTNILAAIMVDETNPNAIEQFANRFRRMESVPLFVVNTINARQTLLPFPFAPKDYFERHFLNAEMQAHIYAHSVGRDGTSGVGISSRSKFAELNDHVYFHRGEYAVNTPALIAATEALTLRTGGVFLDDLTLAGMQVQPAQTLEEYCSPTIIPSISQHDTQESTQEHNRHLAAIIDTAHQQQKVIAKNETALFYTMLAETPALLMETLWHWSFDAALKKRIATYFALHPHQQSDESKALAGRYADLWQSNKPERIAKRYCELRALHFDHTAACLLCERFDDDRRWNNFMEHLAMHQRLELDQMNYAEPLLSKIDREKLRREKEIRAMVASSAECGFVFEGLRTQRIPNALHTKAALTERVNAFRNQENRLTKQQAGAMVNALFFCTYKRERNQTTKKFDGYYAFEATRNGIRRKTMAEFLEECGVDGRTYAETWLNCIHQGIVQEQQGQMNDCSRRNIVQELV